MEDIGRHFSLVSVLVYCLQEANREHKCDNKNAQIKLSHLRSRNIVNKYRDKWLLKINENYPTEMGLKQKTNV